MGLIEVPMSDPRPEFNPKTDTLADKGGVQEGNPQKNGPITE